MTYSPINVDAYTAAYSGALAGMAVNGWIVSQLSSNYALATSVAGAFAQAFDVAWNNADPTNSLEIGLATAACSQQFRDRAPTSVASYLLQATWTDAAKAAVALILEADIYFASQGIIPPFTPGIANGVDKGQTLVWDDTNAIFNNLPQSVLLVQPGGTPEPHVTTDLSNIQSYIDTFVAGMPGNAIALLVFDGSKNANVMTITTSLQLYGRFNVLFTNLKRVTLSLSSSDLALLKNPAGKVSADVQTTFLRGNTTSANLITTEAAYTNVLQYAVENIIWDATGNTTFNARPMVRSQNGANVWRFNNCSLQPTLITARTADMWIWIENVAPSGAVLDLVWTGPLAGVMTDGNGNFLATNATGFTTTVTYGAFTGVMLTLPTINWTATTPVLVNRMPQNFIPSSAADWLSTAPNLTQAAINITADVDRAGMDNSTYTSTLTGASPLVYTPAANNLVPVKSGVYIGTLETTGTITVGGILTVDVLVDGVASGQNQSHTVGSGVFAIASNFLITVDKTVGHKLGFRWTFTGGGFINAGMGNLVWYEA